MLRGSGTYYPFHEDYCHVRRMVHLKEELWLAHHEPVFSELGIVELKSLPSVCEAWGLNVKNSFISVNIYIAFLM